LRHQPAMVTASNGCRAQARRHAARKAQAKLFVLDTNVLLHDPTSLFRFRRARHLPADDRAGRTGCPQEGHDRGGAQWPPGQPRTGRPGRRTGADIGRASSSTPQASVRPVAACTSRPTAGIPTSPPAFPSWQGGQPDPGRSGGTAHTACPARSGAGVQGHQHARQGACPGPAAEDYQNDKALEDGDLLYSGALQLPPDFWNRNGKNVESWQVARTRSTASAARSCRS
jgi:PhoH-like ATPase